MNLRIFHRQRLAAALMLVLIVSAACSDKDLRRTAEALNDASVAVGTIQTVLIDANGKGLVPDADMRTILATTRRINAAIGEANTATKGIVKLSPEDRVAIEKILDPVTKSISDALGPIAGIKDETTRISIQAALTTIQTSITVARLALKK